MNVTTRRPGFTLVELLIVMGIIVLAAAILVPVTLSLSERNQVPKAASMIENALQTAKSRALAEKRPVGIRLLAMEPSTLAQQQSRRQLLTGTRPKFAWYDQIQFIHDPGDYVEAWVWGLADPPRPVAAAPQVPIRAVMQPFWPNPVNYPYPGRPIAGFAPVNIAPGNATQPTPPPGILANEPAFQFTAIIDSNGTLGSVTRYRNQLLFGPISTNSTQANTWGDNSGTLHPSQRFRFNYHLSVPRSILPGDKIEVEGIGELFTVVAVAAAVNTVSNIDVGAAPVAPQPGPIRIMCPVIALDRALPRDVSPPLNGRPNYRVIRQPRTIASLPTVNLPQGVIVDLTGSRAGMLGVTNPPADLDTSGSYPMSNVSTGVAVSTISGLTSNVMNPRTVAPPYIDILFSPSGEVLITTQNFVQGNPSLGLNELSSFSVGTADMIALWVHQVGSPDLWADRQLTAAQGNVDNQAFVTVHARTGTIGSYPVARIGTVVPYDPLYNVRLGKARISADTGP